MKTNIGNSQILYDIPMYSTKLDFETGIDTIDDTFVIVKILAVCVTMALEQCL